MADNWRHPERARFLVDPRLKPGAAQPRAEGSRAERNNALYVVILSEALFAESKDLGEPRDAVQAFIK